MALASGLFLITSSNETYDPATQAPETTTLALVRAAADSGTFFEANAAFTLTLKGGPFPAPGTVISLDLT